MSVLDKVTRIRAISPASSDYLRRVEKGLPTTTRKINENIPLVILVIVAVILGAPPCLNWRNWRPQANPDLIEARRARFRIPDTIPTRRATPMPLHLNNLKEKQEKTGS